MPQPTTPPVALSNATPANTSTTGSAGTASQASRSDHVHASPGDVPIGGVVPWFKSLTGVPALNSQWEECDGTAIVNTSSPMFGQNKPNLNGTTNATKLFLRGATTSGGTGGAATVTLTTNELPAHTHAVTITSVNNNSAAGTSNNAVESGSATNDNIPVTSGSAGSGNAFNIIPPTMDAVMVMRVA